MKRFILYAVLLWFAFALIAIIVAGFREKAVKPIFGEELGHAAGTVIFIVLQLLIIYLFVRAFCSSLELRNFIYLGICWFAATVAFEFIFGHYVMGHPWEKLLADYNLLKGRLWSLVLLIDLAAPAAFYYIIRSRISP